MDETLAQAGIFQGVEPAAAEALAQTLTSVAFDRGEVLFREGAPGDRLYSLTAGKVTLGGTSVDGRETLLQIIGPSDMVGELSIFDPGPAHRDRHDGDRGQCGEHGSARAAAVDFQPPGDR